MSRYHHHHHLEPTKRVYKTHISRRSGRATIEGGQGGGEGSTKLAWRDKGNECACACVCVLSRNRHPSIRTFTTDKMGEEKRIERTTDNRKEGERKEEALPQHFLYSLFLSLALLFLLLCSLTLYIDWSHPSGGPVFTIFFSALSPLCS